MTDSKRGPAQLGNEDRPARQTLTLTSTAPPVTPIVEAPDPLPKGVEPYKPMDTAPKDRPITMAPHGMPAMWRQSRKYHRGSWRRYEGWTDWLTHRPLTYEPTGWRD